MANLKSIIYLIKPATVGNRRFTEHEIIDLEDENRAALLEDRGIGFVVFNAPVYAQYFMEKLEEGERLWEIEQFLNRLRLFPFEFRCPQWQQLVRNIDIIAPRKFTNFVTDEQIVGSAKKAVAKASGEVAPKKSRRKTTK